MSEESWVSIIKWGSLIITSWGAVTASWYRWNTMQEKKFKEQSVGEEALRKQNEKIEQLKEQIQELREENRLNWVKFYEIQSKK